ncbi:hypothetical protein GPJ56_008271 [Histomonas meleagridis]|uniref:uncharacterized protein n=1 Tax=Histomonas meleagridis TaxID=135588 RepID=UPI0035599930|nr:hypothetical protein GPJ56_008271 [Histomonas meleagridis]KAH0806840.1 hypothetical protein GO595_000016 [Histomonas meleagridis]
MGPVYKVGKVPITYSANVFSCASFFTLIVYLVAILLPYFFNVWTFNFFPQFERRAERPIVNALPQMRFELTGPTISTPLTFTVDSDLSSITESTRIPIIQYPRKGNDRIIKISAYFPKTLDETITSAKLNLKLETRFNDIGKTFNTSISVNSSTVLAATSLNIIGSLSFTQEKPISFKGTEVILSDDYIDFTQDMTIPLNSSYPLISGSPFFKLRNEIWTFGNSELFELHFSMRVPYVKYYVDKSDWYSFLNGFTSYIATAVPLFIIAWFVLEKFFGSQMIPVKAKIEAKLNETKIPKFNR